MILKKDVNWLRRRLNSTKERHNGWGYTDFVRTAEANRHNGKYIGKSSMARTFNVDLHTMDHWLKIYEKGRESK